MALHFQNPQFHGMLNPEAVYFEVQGYVRTISSVSQIPASVFPGQDVIVTATISNTSNLGQGYYLRYTTDGFATSSIVELTGAGTSFSATIPGSTNTANANLDYYVFSSGSGLTIAEIDADFFIFSLNNNLGSNYSYTVAPYWESAASGDWETATTWTANAIPSAGQPIQISHTVSTAAASNISFKSLEITGSGNLTLGLNSDFTLTEPLGISIDGNLTASSGSTVKLPFGGYLGGSGTTQFYNLGIGVNGGSGNQYFYLDSGIEISNDLNIEENGGLFPGNAKSITLEMSGASGSLYNDGRISSTPDLGDINNERLAFLFSGAQTTLRGNGGVAGDRTQFSDITINNGASLVSDAAGTLNAELQFGTLTNNGVFNMGLTATGRVNFTLRGIVGNDYFIHSDNVDQVFQFSDLLIGNAGPTDGAHLQLNSSSENIVLRISGDFENYYKFTHTNSDPANMSVVLNGNVDQSIIGQMAQTDGNQITFRNLEIANSGGNVYLASISPNADADLNISYEIEGVLKLTSGKLVSINGGNRHNLILGENASIDASGAQSDEVGQPCYIEGPLVCIAGIGTNTILTFPVGQGDDFRNLEIKTDIATTPVQFKVEHFAYSANFVGMGVLSPITNVSDIRFWNVKVDQPTNVSNTTFEIAYGDADTDGVTDENELRVVWAEQDASTDMDGSNDDWIGIGNTGGASNSITSGSFSFSAALDKIDITLGNIGPGVNPLPVTWLDISCTNLIARNLIEWSTASESNSSHFIVERASSDFEFFELGRKDAQGWSNQKTEYSFSDNQTLNGVSYYRIKQVDFDGTFDFSDIVSSVTNNQSSAYPNPFGNYIRIETSSILKGSLLEIFNSTGAVIHQQKIDNGPIQLSTTDWPLGIYIARTIQINGQALYLKLVKAN